MSRKKAALTLDPFRRDDQVAYIQDRAEKIFDFGDQIWASITEDQALGFAKQGIQVQFHDAAGTVTVPSVAFVPPDEPVPPQDLRAQEPSGTDSAYYIVEFAAPPDETWINAVASLEAVYAADIPALSAAFRMTSDVASQVRGLPFIDWVGLYHPAYALIYQLAGRDQRLQPSELSNLQVDPSRIVKQDSATVQITFFSDVASADMVAAVQAAGASVTLDTGHSLLVGATADQVRALLRIPGVELIDRYRAAELHNHRGRIIVGANQVQSLRSVDFLVNLDGAGETAGVIDTGVDTGNTATLHPDLKGRVQFLPNLNSTPGNVLPLSDPVGHGTHVTGSVIGDGTKSAGVVNPPPNHSIPRGIAPAAQVIFQAVAVPSAKPNFGNYVRGLENAHQAGARVHSNSYGNDNANQYTSQRVDRLAYLRPESLLLFSAGNSEADANSDGILDMNFLGDDAVSKNILTIGACENATNSDGRSTTYRDDNPTKYSKAAFDKTAGDPSQDGDFPQSDNANDLALFSERGRVVRNPPPGSPPGTPAPPGRVKPDLVAPGTNVMSTRPVGLPPFSDAFEIPKTAPDGFYFVISGTSMATPIAAGAAVLTRQFYRARFGQSRRPQLIEAVSQFTDLPAASLYPSGCVLAWIRHDAAGANHVAAAIYNRDLIRQSGIAQLQTNVGAHPAIAIATHGAETLLVHRAQDNTLKLSKYDAHLVPVAGFGTAGVVTLAPVSRPEDNRRPSLCVHGDEAAVVWNQTATDNLLFQRFNANTGAKIDAAPVNLGTATYTSANPYVLHNGTQYAVLWGRFDGTNHQVLLRFVDGTGAAVGPNPSTVVSQPQPIRDPHFAWDTRQNRYLAVWVSTVTHAGGDLITVPIHADGTLDPALTATASILSPAANTVRQPFIAMHPVTGYVLAWEDDTQNSSFDVYVAFLDNNGRLEGTRITERDNRLRVSDTPNPTAGFAALVDATGVLPVWQSNDEINSDQLGAYVLSVTPQGAFQAQVDPNVPLLNSGRYVRHQLVEHADPHQTGVALAWAGGSSFFLRAEPRAAVADLMLVRVSADGKPETTFGANGARKIDTDSRYERVCLKFAGSHLIAAATRGSHAKVFLFDPNGAAIAGFGTNGVKDLGATAADTIFPQLDFQGTGAALRVLVAFGVHAKPTPKIRYAVFDVSSALVGAIHDLTTADGSARHGWFHFAGASAPPRSIAVWHQKSGATTNLALNRFDVAGAAQHSPALQPTAIPGLNLNGSLGPRRVQIPNPVGGVAPTLQLEYGLVWQNQASAAARWEIRFSQLDANGQRKAPTATIVQDRIIVTSPTDHCTDPQLVWHTDGYGLAWLQQPSAGGNHTLSFATMDPNGVITPPPFFQVSDSTADVQDFQLVWNGRRFRTTWTEVSGGKLRHMQQAIAVPSGGGPASYDHPYLQPSSALLRATLINGATNLRKTALPNVGNDPNDGYGWGRINLRQSLSPAPPVTFYVRDDNSVSNSVKYEFTLPTDTLLLRVTLVWNDPPIPTGEIVNVLGLKVTTPAFPTGPARTYTGNNWKPAPNAQYSAPTPAAPPPFENIHNVQQVVIPGEPTLPAGVYTVEVSATISQASLYQQFNGQPFVLVFVGSGREWTLFLPPTGPLPFY
jgi:hypothetical protein